MDNKTEEKMIKSIEDLIVSSIMNGELKIVKPRDLVSPGDLYYLLNRNNKYSKHIFESKTEAEIIKDGEQIFNKS